ncbi:methionyl-tRNA formyltransferase [Sulfobacillus thermotolerans]|uniref:Methionyl-tRNA formyltransferase n=1 Tax=Sulfobacillus thermotolerans TaxID=338644 RepID=A0ABN5H4Q9_9FIRM|nr:methionyl-tRNA formyltransferase [Sulfobacillus thermotolerans]
MNGPRILFFGTPHYARIILLRLLQDPTWEVRVVTKPDVPQGRRLQMTPSPVAQAAKEAGVQIDKPAVLKEFRQAWEDFAPDLIITAAYGKILRPWLLELPRRGAFNLHASILPRWRGPNPIAWAIRAGDRVTGVTLMAMDEGVDTGPVVGMSEVTIGDNATTGSLTQELAKAAGELLVQSLGQLMDNTAVRTPQPEAGITYAPKFDPHDARIDWTRPAIEIHRLVRSMTPDPGAYTVCCQTRIKITECAYDEGEQMRGRARLYGNAWKIGTGNGVLTVTKIRPAGRKDMTPGDFIRGQHISGEVVCE